VRFADCRDGARHHVGSDANVSPYSSYLQAADETRVVRREAFRDLVVLSTGFFVYL